MRIAYPSVEVLSAYSTVPTDWADEIPSYFSFISSDAIKKIALEIKNPKNRT